MRLWTYTSISCKYNYGVLMMLFLFGLIDLELKNVWNLYYWYFNYFITYIKIQCIIWCMLHELCFNYMWFHQLHTKSHLNYEFLKLIETCKKKIPYGKFWFVVSNGFFWVNFCTMLTEKVLCELYKRAFQKNPKIRHILRKKQKKTLFKIMSSCKSPELGKIPKKY